MNDLVTSKQAAEILGMRVRSFITRYAASRYAARESPLRRVGVTGGTGAGGRGMMNLYLRDDVERVRDERSLWTSFKVCEVLGVSRNTLCRHIREYPGWLPVALKRRGRMYFRPADAEEARKRLHAGGLVGEAAVAVGRDDGVRMTASEASEAMGLKYPSLSFWRARDPSLLRPVSGPGEARLLFRACDVRAAVEKIKLLRQGFKVR